MLREPARAGRPLHRGVHAPLHVRVTCSWRAQLRDAVCPRRRGHRGHARVQLQWIRKCQLQQLRQDDAQYYPRAHGKHARGCAVSVRVAGDFDIRRVLELEDGFVLAAKAGMFPAWMTPYLLPEEDGLQSCSVLYGRRLVFATPAHEQAFLHPWGSDDVPPRVKLHRQKSRLRLAFPQQQVRGRSPTHECGVSAPLVNILAWSAGQGSFSTVCLALSMLSQVFSKAWGHSSNLSLVTPTRLPFVCAQGSLGCL